MRKNILLSIVVLICLVTVFAVGCVGDCGCNLGGFNLSSCNLPRCSHYWGEGEVTLEAKCDADGVTTYTCSKCGETKEEAITERPAHVWDSGVETKPATEAENGIKTYNCTVCGETKTEETPKLGHTHSYSQTWSNNDTYHWHECGCGDKINYGAHNESDWITDKEPTCAEYGIKHKECTVCGKKITTTSIEKQEHEWETLYTHDSTQHWKKCKDCPATTTKTAHFYENGACVCGKNEPAYVRNGKTIYFGNYPQSEVKDTALISTLNTLAGTLPTSSNSQAWTSYGYYISGSVQDYMWYIDVTYGEEKYRGVYFRTYRPLNVLYESTYYYSMQEVNGYYPNHVYWFKYEPIFPVSSAS